jgi:hypothetical protein
VLGWAGMRGVVTLAVALSVPEDFHGHDFILVTAFAVIVGTVLIQGTTLGIVIRWAGLSETEADRARLTMSQAEAAMAKAQVTLVERRAYDAMARSSTRGCLNVISASQPTWPNILDGRTIFAHRCTPISIWCWRRSLREDRSCCAFIAAARSTRKRFKNSSGTWILRNWAPYPPRRDLRQNARRR